MSPVACVILALGAIGHAVLWIALVNRIHALGIKRHWVDLLTAICVLFLGALPFLILAILVGFIPPGIAPLTSPLSRAVWTYLTFCSGLLLVAAFQRWRWSHNPERHGALISNHRAAVHVAGDRASLLSPGITFWLGSLPGNEV